MIINIACLWKCCRNVTRADTTKVRFPSKSVRAAPVLPPSEWRVAVRCAHFRLSGGRSQALGGVKDGRMLLSVHSANGIMVEAPRKGVLVSGGTQAR